MRNSELMVGREPRHAKLRICNVACYLDKFVFLGLIDILITFRDVWEPVPYGGIGNVCITVVGTRRAVSAVAIKLYQINRSNRGQQTSP